MLLTLWAFPGALLDRTIRPPLPIYPAPQLQPSPRADMQRFYAVEMQRLNSTGWVDRARGAVHIPIAQAMGDVARDGIAGWPTKPRRSQ